LRLAGLLSEVTILMRVSFVLPNANLGGGTRVIALFAEHLQKRGHDVLVVSTPPRPPRLREQVRSLVRGNGWPRRLRSWHTHLDDRDVPQHVIDRSRPIVDADLPDADIVIATWWETAEWVARLGPRKGVKAYFIQQYEANFGQPEDQVAATWRLPMQKIVCSQWLANLARDLFGDSTAIVTPNGIDLDLFHAPPRGKQSRPTVGLMYSTAPVKACDVALATVAKAAQHVPDLHLRAFGLQQPVSWLPLPPGTDYMRQPLQSRLREIYAACDVWICTSRSEGYHLPPHEAMACRCPVVSTRVGGPIELVDEGVNGYLVDVGDVDTLVARLVDVLTLSEPSWRQMSNAALATAKRFTWHDATDRFEEALFRTLEIGRERLRAPKAVGGHCQGQG
jgi:glycosyltransferase involved in cell wall biosynthesis